MEIKLKAGDSLNIPDGCKAVIKGNVVIFERVFQEGDVLHSVYDSTMLIFKRYTSNVYFSSYYNNHNLMRDIRWGVGIFRYATEEEKEAFFKEMKENGLRWNAEKKIVESLRWRAEIGEKFYFLDSDLSVLDGLEEGSKLDDSSWNSGNYFQTAEQAQEAAKPVKEALRKYHEEIGE